MTLKPGDAVKETCDQLGNFPAGIITDPDSLSFVPPTPPANSLFLADEVDTYKDMFKVETDEYTVEVCNADFAQLNTPLICSLKKTINEEPGSEYYVIISNATGGFFYYSHGRCSGINNYNNLFLDIDFWSEEKSLEGGAYIFNNGSTDKYTVRTVKKGSCDIINNNHSFSITMNYEITTDPYTGEPLAVFTSGSGTFSDNYGTYPLTVSYPYGEDPKTAIQFSGHAYTEIEWIYIMGIKWVLKSMTTDFNIMFTLGVGFRYI